MTSTRNRAPWHNFRKWLKHRFTANELVGAYNEPSSNPIAQFLQTRIGREISVTTVQMYVHSRVAPIYEYDYFGYGGPPPEWVKYFLRVAKTYGTKGRMKQRRALRILKDTIEIYRKAND